MKVEPAQLFPRVAVVLVEVGALAGVDQRGGLRREGGLPADEFPASAVTASSAAIGRPASSFGGWPHGFSVHPAPPSGLGVGHGALLAPWPGKPWSHLLARSASESLCAPRRRASIWPVAPDGCGYDAHGLLELTAHDVAGPRPALHEREYEQDAHRQVLQRSSGRQSPSR